MKFFYFLFLALIFTAGFLPALVSAEELGLVQQFAACEGNQCGTCQVVQLANGLIMWLIAIVFLLFAILLVRAGIKLVLSGGNPGALQDAKDSFINALVGFIIILAAWLIVDTLMRALVGKAGDETSKGLLFLKGPDGKEGSLLWSEIKCTQQIGANECKGKNKGGNCQEEIVLRETGIEPANAVDGYLPMCGPNPCSVGTAETGLSDPEARSNLTAGTVTLKSSASLEGVRPHVIAEVNRLSAVCGCNIVITSGTDGSHAGGTYSHANGYKIDIRTNDNPQLLEYVQRNMTPAGKWSDGTQLYSSGKATYAIEGDHIDVRVLP